MIKSAKKRAVDISLYFTNGKSTLSHRSRERTRWVESRVRSFVRAYSRSNRSCENKNSTIKETHLICPAADLPLLLMIQPEFVKRSARPPRVPPREIRQAGGRSARPGDLPTTPGLHRTQNWRWPLQDSHNHQLAAGSGDATTTTRK